MLKCNRKVIRNHWISRQDALPAYISTGTMYETMDKVIQRDTMQQQSSDDLVKTEAVSLRQYERI